MTYLKLKGAKGGGCYVEQKLEPLSWNIKNGNNITPKGPTCTQNLNKSPCDQSIVNTCENN